MDTTKIDFENRKIEIQIYFLFLEKINDTDCTRLKFKKNNETIEEKIPEKLREILVANAFLILYNLIESTVRNSIVEIYTKINDDDVSYENLSSNLQKIWINKKVNNLKEGNYNNETLSKSIENIAQNILTKETIELSKEDIDISGNIDAQKIRDLAQNIGFDTSSNGRNLVEIKNKRNRLAHGEQTFYDVGKDFTFNELNRYKQETFDYLLDVIEKIEIFIVAQKYKVTP